MLRLIGCVLVIACTTAFGINCASRLGTRVKTISGIISALEVMRSEICDRLTPMTQLMQMMAEQTEAPVNALFKSCSNQMDSLGNKSFYFIWKYSITNCEALELKPQEQKTLIDLGQVLGRYDTEEQSKSISHGIRRFEHYLRDAEEEKKSQGKLHAVLGIAAGFFAVIILI